jgi:hypothetical protein
VNTALSTSPTVRFLLHGHPTVNPKPFIGNLEAFRTTPRNSTEPLPGFDIPPGFAYSSLEFDRPATCLTVSFDEGDLRRSGPISQRLRNPFWAITQCLILTSTQPNRSDATPRNAAKAK